MSLLLVILLGAAVILTVFFSTLTYALRDFSRAKFTDFLESRGRGRLATHILDHIDDLIFATASLRLVANITILLCLLKLFESASQPWWVHYLVAAVVTLLVTSLCSVAIPHAASRHAAEAILAACAGLLSSLRWVMMPVTKIMRGVDNLVLKLAGGETPAEPQEIDQEILSVVEEGQKEGVMDEQEREMIESVIEFRDTQVAQIMTARPEIVALESTATLPQVKKIIEESGNSRIPVYEQTIDHVIGILYARDLLKHLGEPPEIFNIRSAIRPAMFVPETKPLRDLLRDFKHQKVHLAIVADEYGGTAGLVTIEDILEELVGEISDEHEPVEPALLKKIDDKTAEVDARLPVVDLNRQMKITIPQDSGYETLGGFVSVTVGRIPAMGTVFVHQNVRYTILAAEPQRVTKVRVEVLGDEAQAESAEMETGS